MNTLTTQNHTPAIQIASFDQLVKFADIASRSGMVPAAYNGKPQAVLIAVQMGSELGLAPMQSLQNIAVINGRPSVWGDALLGLVKASPVCDDVVETMEGEGDALTAICVAKRKGKSPVEARFSVEDAKNAGLWSKQGPWKQYPKRMLQMRARGFALRDAFPDVLRGLISAEEAADIPQDDFRQSVANQKPIDLTPEPQRPATQERRPIDYVAMFDARLSQCTDIACVDRQWKAWSRTVEKAKEAGKPIDPEMVERIQNMIGERMADMQERENQIAAEQAEVEAVEVPA
ncbi:hypothetical protein [Komagataeibacter phage phiKX1]|nr:hypothetical protein [Komagataeibacter phage phiKX1]BCZ76181.1 hypothetical protein [Komagataeibacter phage phiKX2]